VKEKIDKRCILQRCLEYIIGFDSFDKISVDEICKCMKISRRTFYKKFVSKERWMIELGSYFIQNLINEIIKPIEHKNAIHEALYISKCIKKYIKKVSPSLVYDLINKYPQVWENMKNIVHASVVPFMVRHIKRGQMEGLYRKEVNPEQYAILRLSMVDVIHSKYMYETMGGDIEKIYTLVVDDMYLNSILTEKGRKELAEILSKKR